MKPSEVPEKNRAIIRRIVAARQLSDPRVYGSVLHCEDRMDSDLDIPVGPFPNTTLFTLGGVQWQLEEALGIAVDVKVPGDFPPDIREHIVAEALAI